jgi:hypothetical protein
MAVVLLAAAAATTALLLGGAGAAATASAGSPATSYAALSGTEPTELPLVDSVPGPGEPHPSGPTWPAQTPEGATNWPIAASIRKIPLSTPGLSGWIASSTAGGVCVLLYDGAPVKGIAAVNFGCSTAAQVDRGATVEVSEIPGQPGKVISAGVVPDGVTSVSSTMADGSTDTVGVQGNAWSRVTDQPAAAGQETTETTGG